MASNDSLKKRVDVPKRYKQSKRRFGRNQQVDIDTASRTAMRLASLGSVKGVNLYDKNGVTGREARLVRRAKARRRYKGNPATTEKPTRPKQGDSNPPMLPSEPSGGVAAPARAANVYHGEPSGSRSDVRRRRQNRRARRREQRKALGDWLYPNDRSIT